MIITFNVLIELSEKANRDYSILEYIYRDEAREESAVLEENLSFVPDEQVSELLWMIQHQKIRSS